jgi:hypothetical protein
MIMMMQALVTPLTARVKNWSFHLLAVIKSMTIRKRLDQENRPAWWLLRVPFDAIAPRTLMEWYFQPCLQRRTRMKRKRMLRTLRWKILTTICFAATMPISKTFH